MKAIETKLEVTKAGTMTIPVPPGICPGEHEVLIVIDEQVTRSPRREIRLPELSVGRWPNDLSLRRKDMYGDDGR